MTEAIDHSPRLVDVPPAGATPQGLIDRAKLALIAVERTPMPMVVTDPNQPDGPIILVNAAFLAMTGYSADEVIGRNSRFLQGPSTAPADVAAIRAGLASGTDFICEILNHRKDGSTFWNQLHISPVYDSDGRLIYHLASQLDITRRREALALEAAELALLKEIDHRAKNALALVQGIVRLSCADDSKVYARSVQGRVDALANAHALLAAAGWRDIALDRLLASETAPLGQGRCDVAGPSVAIPVEHVQPLTLLIHELIGNAVAHGALSNPVGRLTIRWSRTSGEVSIDFAESGGPKPPPVRTPGFGLKMGAAIARRQLRGRLDFDWRDEGLLSRVVVPLEPVPA